MLESLSRLTIRGSLCHALYMTVAPVLRCGQMWQSTCTSAGAKLATTKTMPPLHDGIPMKR